LFPRFRGVQFFIVIIEIPKYGRYTIFLLLGKKLLASSI